MAPQVKAGCYKKSSCLCRFYLGLQPYFILKIKQNLNSSTLDSGSVVTIPGWQRPGLASPSSESKPQKIAIYQNSLRMIQINMQTQGAPTMNACTTLPP